MARGENGTRPLPRCHLHPLGNGLFVSLVTTIASGRIKFSARRERTLSTESEVAVEQKKAESEKSICYLKMREDPLPIELVDGDSEDALKLADGAECSWAKEGDSISRSDLRRRVEPWLTALFQSEHLSLLAGSGLTHAVHGLAGAGSLPGMDATSFPECVKAIEAEALIASKRSGRKTGNIEDKIRVANELLRGLEILSHWKPNFGPRADELRTALDAAMKCFACSILKGEQSLADADEDRKNEAFNYLVNFLMSFASRSGTRDRLHIFTTNYDRYIEAGAELAGLHLLDRFVGNLTPIFRSSRLETDLHYNPPGIRGEPRHVEGVARFTKLHGSVDWVASERDIRRIGLPFGAPDISPFLKALRLTDSDALKLMIYPNAAKDRETAEFPYVDLFRDFAAFACRPNTTLVSYGYSFGDEHINRVIEDMLTVPSTHLVIISYDDPLGRIMKTYERLGRPAQISLLIGSQFADLRTFVDNFLPKPAIDRTTIRMAELLRARYGTSDSSPKDSSTQVVQPGASEE